MSAGKDMEAVERVREMQDVYDLIIATCQHDPEFKAWGASALRFLSALAHQATAPLCEHGHTDIMSLCNQCEAQSIDGSATEQVSDRPSCHRCGGSGYDPDEVENSPCRECDATPEQVSDDAVERLRRRASLPDGDGNITVKASDVRDALARQATRPTDVICPICNAPVGKPCVTNERRSQRLDVPHKERSQATSDDAVVELIEELRTAASDLRATSSKVKQEVESASGFSLDAIADYTHRAADALLANTNTEAVIGEGDE